MSKNQFLFLAAAASVAVLTGCSTPIMEPRPVVTANPARGQALKNDYRSDENSLSAPEKDLPAPQAQPQQAYQRPAYAPMTDVVSSGGVDSVPRRAVKRAGKKSSGRGAVAAGGVYIVKRGDSPERIARRFKVRVSDLMRVNNLTEASARRIQIGQKLVIPGKKGAAAAPAKKAVRKSSNAAASTGSATLTDGKYTVKRGDSPERIARRFKIKVAELMAANNLTEASARRIQIGQKLIIPGSGSAIQAKKASAAETGSAGAAPAVTGAAAADGEVTDVASAISSDATVSDTPAANAAAPAANNADTTPAAGAAPAPADSVSGKVESDDSSNISVVEYTGGKKTIAEVAAMYGLTVEEFLKHNGDKRDLQFISGNAWIVIPKDKNTASK